MAAVCVVGATGLVGSHVLSTLQASKNVRSVFAYARKELPVDAKTTYIVSQQSSEWPSQYPANTDVFISALGTTRATAGGFEKQRSIDYDLNLELAKAAKSSGVKAYVLVSSSGADSSSIFGYPKMKGELEEQVRSLDFDNLVILRPGLLIGSRNGSLRTAEFALQKVAGFAGAISGSKLKDFWAQDAEVVAKAAVHAGLASLKSDEKVVILSQSDIIRLGRTEWKE